MSRYPVFGVSALMAFLLIWCGGCARYPQVLLPHNACGPPLSDYSLFIGPIEGPYGSLIAEVLERKVVTPKDLYPRYILTGRVEVTIQDISGQDTVKTRREIGPPVETTVHDDFVDKDFTIKEPEHDLVALPLPFIERSASLNLIYHLTTPTGGPTPYGCKTGVEMKRKYGGLNQDLGIGHRVEDLPAKETTVRFLAEALAAKLAPLVNPDLAWRSEPLDEGTGFWGEPEIKEGVVLAQAGQWDEAAAIWQKVLKEDPAHPSANYNLGLYHERRGDDENLKKAYQYYTKAAKNGNRPFYRQALTRIFIILREKGIQNKDQDNEIEKLFS